MRIARGPEFHEILIKTSVTKHKTHQNIATMYAYNTFNDLVIIQRMYNIHIHVHESANFA
jgi:hypothetical protein